MSISSKPRAAQWWTVVYCVDSTSRFKEFKVRAATLELALELTRPDAAKDPEPMHLTGVLDEHRSWVA